MVGLFCWKWHCWKYYQVPFPLGQGLTQKDICVSDGSTQMDTLTLLCDPRTRSWSWALAPSFTNCNCSPTFKNCFPLGKLFHPLLSNVVLHPSFTLGYITHGLHSVITVGSLGHIWVRGCLSLAHSMELRRDFLYKICWRWLLPCLGSLLFWTSFTFFFFLRHVSGSVAQRLAVPWESFQF